MWRAVLLLSAFSFVCFRSGDSLTINSHIGLGDGGRIGTILNFDISPKSEMHCFYETIKDKATIRIHATAVNGASNEIHMRISSPTEVFSEWFQGTGSVKWDGEAQEEGDHEFCVTSRVSYGDLRVNVELFSYLESDVQQAVQDHVATNELRSDMSKRIDQLFNNTWTSYYAMRYANLMIRRDESAQEHNLYVIDLMSSLQTGIFLITACTQVYFVRKMFRVDTSRIRI